MPRRIVTAREHLSKGIKHFVEQAQRSHSHGIFDMPTEVAAMEPIEAVVDDNRWIILCPSCTGAAYADEEDAVFFCLSCKNEDVDGKWLPTTFPPNRKAIETALLKRREPHRRHWRGQRVADLTREDAQHHADIEAREAMHEVIRRGGLK